MHGTMSLKFIDAKQANEIYNYKNTQRKVCRTNAAIWYNIPTWPRWREVAVQILWPVPVAEVRVFSTPDDGCCGHPKHVDSK